MQERIELPSGEIITGEMAHRASRLSHKLKNVIMGLLIKQRENRKVPKLKEILQKAIEREHR